MAHRWLRANAQDALNRLLKANKFRQIHVGDICSIFSVQRRYQFTEAFQMWSKKDGQRGDEVGTIGIDYQKCNPKLMIIQYEIFL